jgi:hypothetical protein
MIFVWLGLLRKEVNSGVRWDEAPHGSPDPKSVGFQEADDFGKDRAVIWNTLHVAIFEKEICRHVMLN